MELLGNRRRRHAAHQAEAVIGILKSWRDTRTGRATRYLHMMAPRSSPRGLPLPFVWAPWIVFRRSCIITRVVPVAAPFVNVIAKVINAESIGSVEGHDFRAGLPSGGIVRQRLRRFVAPGEILLLGIAACGTLPFGLGGKTELATSLRGEPPAVAIGFIPGNRSHRLSRGIEIGIVPERRRVRFR